MRRPLLCDILSTTSPASPEDCVYADTKPEQIAWVDVSDQSHVDSHDPCRTKSLYNARHRQQRQRMRKCAKQRCQREQH